MAAILIALVLAILGSNPADGQTATHADETTLRAALQSGYDTYTRPYTPTQIDIIYTLRSVQKLSIADQTLSQTAFLQIFWHDPRLVWNSSAYSNITVLDVNWAWRPVYVVVNSVDNGDVHGSDNDETQIVVYSNGTVVWRYLLVSMTTCDVNIQYFPYDTQSCTVNLLFSGHDDSVSLSFNLSSNVADLEFYLENAEWVLQSTSLTPMRAPVCCPQFSLIYLAVEMSFKRLHAFYLNTFLIPTILLSICVVWPFFLPSESGERLGFALTILLSYTVVLTIATSYLPTTSKQVPILAVYLLIVLVICTLAVCNVALNVKMYHLETAVPNYIKKFYRNVKPIVFFQCKKQKNKVRAKDEVLTIDTIDTEKQPIEKPPISPERSRADSETPTDDVEDITWKNISELLDRICLTVYSLCVFLVNLILMTILSVAE